MGLRELARRVGMLFRRRFDEDLDEEMRLHVDLRAAEARAAGLAPDAAAAAARRRFGNATVLREDSRDAWGWRWLEDLGKDARYGLRGMARNPGFTLVAVLALALGIGANTAILSVVGGVLLRPLPYADPDGLMTILHGGNGPTAPANIYSWRAQCQSFEALGAAEAWRPNLSGAGIDQPDKLAALRLTPDVLPLLGVPPLLGRTFGDEEGLPGREHVIVLGWDAWQQRFGGDPRILDRSIILDGESYAVIGVMPRGFKFAPFWVTTAQAWAPLVLGPNAGDRHRSTLRPFARLKRGVSVAAARAEMAAVAARLEEAFPGTNRNLEVIPLEEKVVGQIRPALLVLLGAVGFVLLVACANVAHMLLARAQARQREIVVRTALGAGRGRLIRQLLTESLMLALLGGGAGVVLGVWGVDLLRALEPTDVPRVASVSVDGAILAVMAGVSILCGIGFGLVPALRATAVDLSSSLKEGGRGATDGARQGRLRGVLVISQFALALPLLVGAGLMIRSFAALQAIDPGFASEGVLTLQVSLAGTSQARPGRPEAFYPEVLRRVGALPGVASASAINHLPLAGDIWGVGIDVEGEPTRDAADDEVVTYRAVFPGYFRTMGIPILRGRDISAADDGRAPDVVVINQKLADEHWSGGDAVGKRISAGPDQRRLTIVGVVKDARQHDWAETLRGEVYVSVPQTRSYLDNPHGPFAYMTFVVRTAGDPAALAGPIRAAVRDLDPAVTISELGTMTSVVARATSRPRFYLTLLGAFAGLALVLAAVGIYGVMSYAVSRRSQELGIRMALGATRGDVLRLVVKGGLGLALVGVVVGLAGAAGLARLMTGLLYGVTPADPVTLGGVAFVLLAVAVLASVVPARRATRIDPMTALRND